jgi:hypothetical protein
MYITHRRESIPNVGGVERGSQSGVSGECVNYHGASFPMSVVTSARSPAAQTSGRMLVLPLAFTLGLVGLAVPAPVRQNPKLLSAFLGAAVALCAWTAVLLA